MKKEEEDYILATNKARLCISIDAIKSLLHDVTINRDEQEHILKILRRWEANLFRRIND